MTKTDFQTLAFFLNGPILIQVCKAFSNVTVFDKAALRRKKLKRIQSNVMHLQYGNTINSIYQGTDLQVKNYLQAPLSAGDLFTRGSRFER